MADDVFINKLSAIHKGSPGKSMAFPDVNLCPPSPPAGPVPTPLPNIAAAKDLAGGATSVKIHGNPVAKKSSYFAKSTGNAMARSTGGGIVTHVVEGKAYFASFSMNVKIEGEPVPRHLDMMTHNHAAPSPGEAVGTYMGSMKMAMPKGPLIPEPKERKEDGKPFDYKIFVDLSGKQAQAPTYQLLSSDGEYRENGKQSGTEGGLTVLKFTKVLPAKTYSLKVMVQSEVDSVLFANVPSSLLAEHQKFGDFPSQLAGSEVSSVARVELEPDVESPESTDEAE
ncbi:MAG: DUF4150 domain-containing protein [Deltaproteobacteria bacterium]|nr:DUF4150 domain-containing protein [Deltaproteobacteria bacterium]